nr:unnamed protein product [Callosobruchus chinensis]
MVWNPASPSQKRTIQRQKPANYAVNFLEIISRVFRRLIGTRNRTIFLICIRNPGLRFISTKYLGKKPSPKAKSITIVHKSTTEAVRLPPDGEGVISHPIINSKVPLKRKVRDGKVRRKRKGKVESINNNLNSPNKTKASPKKKKRVVSAAIGAEDAR